MDKKIPLPAITFFVILLIFSSLFLHLRYRDRLAKKDIKSKNTSIDKKYYGKIITYRDAFLKMYSRQVDLLRAYEDGSHYLAAKNLIDKPLEVNSASIPFSINHIKNAIDIDPTDSKEVKMEKIFNFVERYSFISIPLFEGFSLHIPQRFFSIFESGFCDDQSTVLSTLAKMYGIESRLWWLTGHVTADIKYNEKWHIYDHELGLIRNKDNEVASIDYIIELAKQNKLTKYNDEYKTTKNNRTSLYHIFIAEKLMEKGDPYITFLPGERRFFYNEAFMLTTDGHYLEERLKENNKFANEYSHMANYIREIPLSELTVTDKEIIIEDYFPIAGAFILIKDTKKIPESIPIYKVRVLLDSDVLSGPNWISAKILKSPILKYPYLDLSPGLKNLEFSPSYKIKIKGLDNLLRNFDDVRLLTVHYFSLKNMDFGQILKDSKPELLINQNQAWDIP